MSVEAREAGFVPRLVMRELLAYSVGAYQGRSYRLEGYVCPLTTPLSEGRLENSGCNEEAAIWPRSGLTLSIDSGSGEVERA